jgi:hypothetical protein
MPDRDAELVHDGDQGSVLAAAPGAAGAVIGVVVATIGARLPVQALDMRASRNHIHHMMTSPGDELMFNHVAVAQAR